MKSIWFWHVLLTMGSRGCLFLCPSTKTDGKRVKVTRIEEEMGLHASPTCQIFDGAEAELIGEGAWIGRHVHHDEPRTWGCGPARGGACRARLSNRRSLYGGSRSGPPA